LCPESTLLLFLVESPYDMGVRNEEINIQISEEVEEVMFLLSLGPYPPMVLTCITSILNQVYFYQDNSMTRNRLDFPNACSGLSEFTGHKALLT
jgi:hypothetical protein